MAHVLTGGLFHGVNRRWNNRWFSAECPVGPLLTGIVGNSHSPDSFIGKT